MSSSTVRPAPLALASRRAETFRFRLALSSHRARRVPSRAVLARCSNASSSPSRTSAATEAFALGASLASDPIPLASLASNSAAQDAFDVVVWGATGFTGRLVARHLARHAPPSLRWAVAARSDDKLRALVGELVDRGDAETLVPMFHGDAADADDMTGLAAVSRCVISAAGPYGAHGGVLVGACARAGSHYADLTGEPGWMRAVIDAHDAVARDTGAMIVPCAGFDSVPSDVGSYRAAAELTRPTSRRKDAKSNYVSHEGARWLQRRNAVHGLAPRGGPGRAVEFLRCRRTHPRFDPGRERSEPAPARVRRTRTAIRPRLASMGQPLALRALRHEGGAAPVALLNARTDADASADESACPYDGLAEFCYEGKLAAFELGTPVGWASAKITASLIEAAVRGAADDDTRRRMKAALPKAGEGPPEWFRESGFWEMRFRAEGANGERVWTRMAGGSDPGYGDTSRVLAEVGVLLAEGTREGGALEGRSGGVLTPAVAFGDAILPRLAEHGITYEVEGDEPRGVWF